VADVTPAGGLPCLHPDDLEAIASFILAWVRQ